MNAYVFSTRSETPYAPAMAMTGGKLEAAPLKDWRTMTDGRYERTYRLTNVGDEPLLHVHPVETTKGYWMTADRAFDILFPGQCFDITVTSMPRQGGGWLADDGPVAGTAVDTPDIEFAHLLGK